MELNKKILNICLSLIIITVIATLTLIHIYKIKNPVFLKMFIEKPIDLYENCGSIESLQFKYITNIWDNKKISSIKFKNHPDIQVFISDNNLDFTLENNYNREEHGIYTINTIYVNLGLKNLEKTFKEIEINDAIVFFNDGTMLDINLGQIVLYNYKNDKNSEICTIGNNTEINDTGTNAYWDIEIEKNIKLLKLDSPLIHNLKDYFSASIGNNDYKNISELNYKKGEKSVIKLKIETLKSILGRYSLYDMSPKLYYKNKEEKKSYLRIENIHFDPYRFDLKGILNYLKLRGEI